jgi:hypothetical protein
LVGAVGIAALASACVNGQRNDLVGGGGDDDDSGEALSAHQSAQQQRSATTSGAAGAPQNLPKNISAKDYFSTNVQPLLAGTCSACHAQGPAPTWIVPTDIEKSYALQFQRGYVSTASTILHQGVHDHGAAPALTADEANNYGVWVELELKERGGKVPDGVLQKLAGCLDKTKFDAIGFDKLVTTPRAANNNPGKQAENPDECTGCNRVQCSSCHSADPATGFMMAIGNTIVPDDYTFTEMKTTAPPYMQKYFGLDADGNPIPSKAIKAKSDDTVNVEKAYSHPMFILPPAMEAAIEAFVADAIAKEKAGTCAPAK